jgi:ParB family transcriptional regulator, chromosome partitioning protein
VSADKPRRLGRGLEALIPGAGAPSAATSDLQRVSVSQIRSNPFQPRREFDAVELAELEASLKASGLLQPITVRRRGNAYELVAGERRLRAATNLGWTEITAIIRDFDDRTMLVLALVENLQRSNLNAVEEARGYRRLIEEFQLTQQQVADAVGKDRTTITNLLRVLTLPAPIQDMVERRILSPGHARALLALGESQSPVGVANDAVAMGFSVRQLEQHVRELLAGGPTGSSKNRTQQGPQRELSTSQDPAVRRIEDDLRRYLQTDVRLKLAAITEGKIEIAFYSTDDLERILDLVLRENRKDF